MSSEPVEFVEQRVLYNVDIAVEVEGELVNLCLMPDDDTPDVTIYLTGEKARALGDMLFKHGASVSS